MNLVQNCGSGPGPPTPQQQLTSPSSPANQSNGLPYQNGVTTPASRCSDRLVTGPSCKALKTAVSALYSVDDFIREKIGSGFFSEVYKVSEQHLKSEFIFPVPEWPASRKSILATTQDRNLSPFVREMCK